MNAAKRMIPLIIAWIILLAYFRMKVPGFLARDNMIGLVEQISVNAIIACGMTYCILIGGIDLSVGAVLALVGTVTVAVLNLGAGIVDGDAHHPAAGGGGHDRLPGFVRLQGAGHP